MALLASLLGACRLPMLTSNGSFDFYTYHDYVRLSQVFLWDLLYLQNHLALSSLLNAVHRYSMEYPANILGSTRSPDEKLSSEDVEDPTGTSAPTANVARFISEKLLYWGVEERGAYRIFTFNFRGRL